MNANAGARKIKAAYNWARQKSDAVEAAIKDPNIGEEAFDRLLEAEERALDNLTDAICEGTNGRVSENDAYLLTRRKFDKLGELVARLVV